MSLETESLHRSHLPRAGLEGRHRLLIADDTAFIEPLRGLLRDRNFDVFRADTTEVAWRRYREGLADTVICACNGTGADSDGFLLRLRGTERQSRTHVIVIGDSRDVERGIASGADDFLVGPFETDTLLARLCVAEQIRQLHDDVTRQHRVLMETNRRLTDANAQLHYELRAAARVQQALLPGPREKIPGLEIAWRMRPCEELAGDILNFVRLDEHVLGFWVLDVSGHGISSALLSVQVARLMSPLMPESVLLKEPLPAAPWYRLVEPERVLRKLNQLFRVTEENDKYFTMIYGQLHLASGRVGLAVAGHPAPILAERNGASRSLDFAGNPVGFFEVPDFESLEFVLEPGQRLWLFSDGILDAEDPQGRILGTDGLQKMIVDHAGDPVERATERIMTGVERWIEPGTAEDDCSLLVIERAG